MSYSISWAEYSVTIFLLLILYYTYVLLRFFPPHKKTRLEREILLQKELYKTVDT